MNLKEIEENRDIPLTLTTIQAFRQMLDLMEQFIRDTEREQLDKAAFKQTDNDSE